MVFQLSHSLFGCFQKKCKEQPLLKQQKLPIKPLHMNQAKRLVLQKLRKELSQLHRKRALLQL